MKILTDEEFSTKAIGEPSETELQKSQIYLNGKATDSVVEGVVLEACVKYMDFYLVFMTDDIPNEDMLHIHLFDTSLNLVDSATVGSPYSTGSFESLALFEPNVVKFRFIGGVEWCVELSCKKIFFAPIFSDPKGVWRKFRFGYYFKIRCVGISGVA